MIFFLDPLHILQVGPTQTFVLPNCTVLAQWCLVCMNTTVSQLYGEKLFCLERKEKWILTIAREDSIFFDLPQFYRVAQTGWYMHVHRWKWASLCHLNPHLVDNIPDPEPCLQVIRDVTVNSAFFKSSEFVILLQNNQEHTVVMT